MENQNTLFQNTHNYLSSLKNFLHHQALQLQNLNTVGDEDYDKIVAKAHQSTILNINTAIGYINQLCEELEEVKRQKIKHAKRNQPSR